MVTVEIYTKTMCPFCQRAKDLLQRKQEKISFDINEINVQEQPDKLQEMLERSNGRRTVPEIFINGKLIGGYDDLAEHDRNGTLDPLLKTGVTPKRL